MVAVEVRDEDIINLRMGNAMPGEQYLAAFGTID
jgi:hypothetical protein